MIERLEISSVHAMMDDRLHKYITKKIGSLDRYIPRGGRASAHAEVIIKQSKSSDNNDISCEVTLRLPHEILNVTESMPNAFSAVDLAEATLKHQIAKYKQLHAEGAIRRRLAARFVRKQSI